LKGEPSQTWGTSGICRSGHSSKKMIDEVIYEIEFDVNRILKIEKVNN
jgi:hypothetical protein